MSKYIDVDVLLNNTDGLEHIKYSQEYGHVVLVCDLVYAPPADVVEVKHGKWIEIGDNLYRCSVCDEISCCMGNYCPDCGADMRKGTEDVGKI